MGSNETTLCYTKLAKVIQQRNVSNLFGCGQKWTLTTVMTIRNRGDLTIQGDFPVGVGGCRAEWTQTTWLGKWTLKTYPGCWDTDNMTWLARVRTGQHGRNGH